MRSTSEDIDYNTLTPNNLLVPPLFVSTTIWSKGYAVKVANDNVAQKDLLARHCFYSPSQREYYDEQGVKVESKIEPCGEWVYIVGLNYIDNKISDALNIMRTPLIEDDMWYTSGQGKKVWLKKPLAELKKHLNYEEAVKKYPEIVED